MGVNKNSTLSMDLQVQIFSIPPIAFFIFRAANVYHDVCAFIIYTLAWRAALASSPNITRGREGDIRDQIIKYRDSRRVYSLAKLAVLFWVDAKVLFACWS
jgi:hypothetical protein